MKDVKFPKSVKIGGHNYIIDYPYSFEESGGDRTGSVDYMCGRIKISTTYKGKGRSVQQIKSTFLHETLHAIDHVYNGHLINDMKNCEDVIELLEVTWFQVLRDNELYLKTTNTLPNSVRVGGYDFKVYFPYVFKDNQDRRSQAEVEFQRILIAEDIGHGKHSSSFVQQVLIEALFDTIFTMYSFDSIYRVRKCSMNLSQGLHQILVDNDLGGFFRDEFI